MRWISSGWTKQSSQALRKEKSWTLMRKINEQQSLALLQYVEHGMHAQCWAFVDVFNQRFLPSFLKCTGACAWQSCETCFQKRKRNHICNTNQNVFEPIRTAWKDSKLLLRKLLYNLHIYAHKNPHKKLDHKCLDYYVLVGCSHFADVWYHPETFLLFLWKFLQNSSDVMAEQQILLKKRPVYYLQECKKKFTSMEKIKLYWTNSKLYSMFTGRLAKQDCLQTRVGGSGCQGYCPGMKNSTS